MNSVRVYGADWCEDTQHTRQHLDARSVPYDYINIDHDPDARSWVRERNGGKQKTPTVDVAGHVLVEPEDFALDRVLDEKGLLH
jgi:glutaredoxin